LVLLVQELEQELEQEREREERRERREVGRGPLKYISVDLLKFSVNHRSTGKVPFVRTNIGIEKWTKERNFAR
jgi:hypothetical protein